MSGSKLGDYWEKIKCDTTKHTKPFKCAVISCKHKFNPEFVSRMFKFHKFPTDIGKRQEWIKQCRLVKLPRPNAMVCSKHFSLDDYSRNYKEEFTNPNYQRCLKPDAIPTLYLVGNPVFDLEKVDKLELPPIPHPSKIPDNQYADRCTSHKISEKSTPKASTIDKRKALEIRTAESSETLSTAHEPDSKNDYLQCKTVLSTKVSDLEQLEKEHAELKAADDKLLKTTVDLKVGTRMREVNLAKMVRQNKTKFKRLQQMRKIVNKLYTPAQINILKGRRGVAWSDDDMARGFAIRHLSNKETYLFLKYTLNYPLPSLSTVQRWAAKRSPSE